MSTTPGTQIYIRRSDKERLEAIAASERRKAVDQFSIILDEALRGRGLDPNTLQPLAGSDQP